MEEKGISRLMRLCSCGAFHAQKLFLLVFVDPVHYKVWGSRSIESMTTAVILHYDWTFEQSEMQKVVMNK